MSQLLRRTREGAVLRLTLDDDATRNSLSEEMMAAFQDALDDAAADKTFEIIRSSLGFISVEQARESLFPMANDEVIRRLRIYHRGSVTEDLRG